MMHWPSVKASLTWFRSVWVPTFYGGSENYAVLQNSIFVASETVSDADKAGYFLVGMKISKVWPGTFESRIQNFYL